jgi:hypothetical protein
MPFERGIHQVARIPTQKALGPARSIQLGPGEGPVQGQTVPLTIAPVPEPPLSGTIITDRQSHPLVERRSSASSYSASTERRADYIARANSQVAQYANQLKDALDSPNPATAKQAMDKLAALQEQYPWVIDLPRNVKVKGGVRKPTSARNPFVEFP